MLVWRVYGRRSASEKLITRISVALSASDPQKAAALGERYVELYPGHTAGHNLLSQAYVRLGKYAKAREALSEWVRIEPDLIDPKLAKAETYSHPARTSMAAPGATLSVAKISEIAAQFGQAVRELRRILPKDVDRTLEWTRPAGYEGPGRMGILAIPLAVDPKMPAAPAGALSEEVKLSIDSFKEFQRAVSAQDADGLEVFERIGLNYHRIHMAQRAAISRLTQEINYAESSNENLVAMFRRKVRATAGTKRQTAARLATWILLEVVKTDPSRSEAGRSLVELCSERNDEDSLAEARKAILSLNNPPPVPAMMLARERLRSAGRKIGPAELKARRLEFAKFLDRLVEKHPDNGELKYERAAVAMALEDYDTAENLCDKIESIDPLRGRAQFLLARLAMKQGNYTKAEGVLHALRTRHPHRIEVHLAYARAALATNRPNMAIEAMRAVTRLDPNNAGARRYVAEYLMSHGYLNQAYGDAVQYYPSHPNHPAALRLLVITAVRTRRDAKAAEALRRAWDPAKTKDRTGTAKKVPPPEMLLTVAGGYGLLGREPERLATLRKAIENTDPTIGPRLAVARALTLLERRPEAGKILQEQLRRYPNDPNVRFELGRFHAESGQVLQAIDHYRAAVKLDPSLTRVRLALAKVRFDAGDLNGCEETLGQIDQGNTGASLLRLQIQLLRQKQVTAEDMLRHIDRKPKAGQALAMTYFVDGHYDMCVTVCKSALKTAPDNAGLRFLLGQAFLELGHREPCIQEWATLLAQQPLELPAYERLADVLAEQSTPERVRAMLRKIPGTRRDMIDLTIGKLWTKRGEMAKAAAAYGRAASRIGTPAFIRGRARLLRARALAAGGNPDQALKELDALADSGPVWKKEATAAKIDIQLRMGRRDAAVASMGKLFETATRLDDAGLLRRIAELYTRIGQYKQALKVCDAVQSVRPDDARSYLLAAVVLTQAGKGDQAPAMIEKAIKRQPGNFAAYQALARMLEHPRKLDQALDVLARMERLGPAGKAVSWFEQGRLFARWGLHAQAVEYLRKVASLVESGVPEFQLALGRAFARLGERDQARAPLTRVPQHARQYISARLLLAGVERADAVVLRAKAARKEIEGRRLAAAGRKENADTCAKEAGKLRQQADALLARAREILRELQDKRPRSSLAVDGRMAALLQDNRPQDAVAAYGAYVQKLPSRRKPAASSAFLAIRAMLRTGDLSTATKLAAETAQRVGSARWRYVRILLQSDTDAEGAAAMLPKPSKAGLSDAFLGLITAVRTGKTDVVSKWADRIDEIGKQATQPRDPGAITAHYKILMLVAAGRTKTAAGDIAKYIRSARVGRSAAKELISHAATSNAAATEAAGLLEATMTIDSGLTHLGRRRAMAILKARPQCQWAAALVLETQPNDNIRQRLLSLMRPKDCAIARMIRARRHKTRMEYEKEAEEYRLLAEADRSDPTLPLKQAAAIQRAGRLTQALALYRQVWDKDRSPVAANNAAYVTSQLYPNDNKRLIEALRWADAAVKGAGGVPAFHDTRGWILHLLGRTQQAREAAWRAALSNPQSPEVQYHLGLIEAAAGNQQWSYRHLEAVVLTAAKNPSPDSRRLVELAREWLKKAAENRKKSSNTQ